MVVLGEAEYKTIIVLNRLRLSVCFGEKNRQLHYLNSTLTEIIIFTSQFSKSILSL